MGEPRWSGIDPGPVGAGHDPALQVQVRVEEVRRLADGRWGEVQADPVAVEEPLEIRLEGLPAAITMRTPGHDLDLVAGFLLGEGVIDGPDDVLAMAHVEEPSRPQGNTVDVRLSPGVPQARRQRAQRERYASSSCGVCGKASIDALRVQAPRISARFELDPELLLALPALLRQAQAAFAQTGGLHAAALVDAQGQIEVLREDIGRHNAVDKVLGWRLRGERLPVDDRLLLISGRAGFEIVQKAWMAGVPAIAAVGAPSSLAVSLCREAGIALYGFLRADGVNRYL